MSFTLQNLRHWRLKRDLSQSALAKKTGVTQASISHLEEGRRIPTLRTLSRLADALGVPFQQLLEPPAQPPLSRHGVDRIARFIVCQKEGRPHPALTVPQRELAIRVGSVIIQKLRAHRAPGSTRYGRYRWAVARRACEIKQLYGSQTVTQVLQRVDRLLAMEFHP